MKTFVVTPEEDENGDLILPIPPEFLAEHDWREGDTLSFDIQENSIIITNVTSEERLNNEQQNNSSDSVTDK